MAAERHIGGTRPDGSGERIRYRRGNISLEEDRQVDISNLNKSVTKGGDGASIPLRFKLEGAGRVPWGHLIKGNDGGHQPVFNAATLEDSQKMEIAPLSLNVNASEEGPDANVAYYRNGGMEPKQWIAFARDVIAAETDEKVAKRIERTVETWGYPRIPTKEDAERWIDKSTATLAFGLGNQIDRELAHTKDDRNSINTKRTLVANDANRWIQTNDLDLAQFSKDAKFNLSVSSTPFYEDQAGRHPMERSIELKAEDKNRSSSYKLEIFHAKLSPEIVIDEPDRQGIKSASIRRLATYEEVNAFKELYEDALANERMIPEIDSLEASFLTNKNEEIKIPHETVNNQQNEESTQDKRPPAHIILSFIDSVVKAFRQRIKEQEKIIKSSRNIYFKVEPGGIVTKQIIKK